MSKYAEYFDGPLAGMLTIVTTREHKQGFIYRPVYRVMYDEDVDILTSNVVVGAVRVGKICYKLDVYYEPRRRERWKCHSIEPLPIRR